MASKNLMEKCEENNYCKFSFIAIIALIVLSMFMSPKEMDKIILDIPLRLIALAILILGLVINYKLNLLLKNTKIENKTEKGDDHG